MLSTYVFIFIASLYILYYSTKWIMNQLSVRINSRRKLFRFLFHLDVDFGEKRRDIVVMMESMIWKEFQTRKSLERMRSISGFCNGIECSLQHSQEEKMKGLLVAFLFWFFLRFMHSFYVRFIFCLSCFLHDP